MTPPTPVTLLAEKGVKWLDVKPYPGSCDRVDAWFASFERKLKAAKVDTRHWGERFFECPRVGDELKRIISEAGHSEYPDVRKFCLDRDGPLDPVGFFRNEIHRVSGKHRKEVCEKLTDLLALYNRAARDAGKEAWTERDLIYPFINAFPGETSKHIRAGLKLAMMQPDPFMIIVHRAPEAEEIATEVDPPLLAAVGHKRSRDESSNAQVLAALEKLQDEFRANRNTRNQDGRSCGRCGGTPHSFADCPAKDKTCQKRQQVGHYATCCRSRIAPQSFNIRANNNNNNYNNNNRWNNANNRRDNDANRTPIRPTRPFRQGPPNNNKQ